MAYSSTQEAVITHTKLIFNLQYSQIVIKFPEDQYEATPPWLRLLLHRLEHNQEFTNLQHL